MSKRDARSTNKRAIGVPGKAISVESRAKGWHNQRMLAPQFSLRSILAAMVVCGFVSLIGAAALRGAPWAIAVMISMAALVVILLLQGFMFFILWLASLILPVGRPRKPGESPFANTSGKEA